MQNSSLYVILDANIIKGRDLINFAEEVLKGGADIIQLRDKISSDREFMRVGQLLKILTLRYKAKFIVNDRADITLVAKADGVHLGQDDIPLSNAREILGKDKIIGVSAGSLDEALVAEKEGADYVGLGAIFKTDTKSEAGVIGLEPIEELSKNLTIPFFVIGGINEDNLRDVIIKGARGIAVCSAISLKEDIYKATVEFKHKIEDFKKELNFERK